MKKILKFIAISLAIMMIIPTNIIAASGVIFDFSQMEINDSGFPSSSQGTWGNLAGSRISRIKPGEHDLISDKKYLEITNTTQPDKQGKCSNQFKDYVTLAKGDTLLLTATVMINDWNFQEVGLYATRANVSYIDADGKEGSIADIDFNGGPPLIAFCYDAGMVWLNSWGRDITPESFDFELNRFYKLDVLFKGGENKMDVYLDGEFLQTVDYSDKFSNMVKNNITYNFTDTSKYQSYRISQVKRLAVAQHKPSSSTADLVCGWYNVGYQLYTEADVIPKMTFKTDDFSVKETAAQVVRYDKGEKLIMKQTAAKASEIIGSFDGAGTVKLYKDKNCTTEYGEEEWISYPAYLEYYDVSGLRTVKIPLVTDFYSDNATLTKTGNTAVFSGKMVNIGTDAKSSIVLIAAYSEKELLSVKMQKVSVSGQNSGNFSVSVGIDAECDEVLAWTIDDWENRNVLSDVFRLDI